MQEPQATETPTPTPETEQQPQHKWNPAYEEWFKTPEGTEFKQRVESGEWDERRAQAILGDMAEGRSFEDAKNRRGWKNLPKRVIEDIAAVPGEVAELARDPARLPTEYWKGRVLAAEDFGLEGGAAKAAAGGLVVWDIGVGIVMGLVHGADQIIHGEADLGDILDVGTVALPATRVARTAAVLNKAVLQSAAGQTLKGGRRVFIPKRIIEQALSDPLVGAELKTKLAQLQKAGRVMKHAETGMEIVNLGVQNEEWFLELAGAVGIRAASNTMSAAFGPGDTTIQEGVEAGVRDFAFESMPGLVDPITEAATHVEQMVKTFPDGKDIVARVMALEPPEGFAELVRADEEFAEATDEDIANGFRRAVYDTLAERGLVDPIEDAEPTPQGDETDVGDVDTDTEAEPAPTPPDEGDAGESRADSEADTEVDEADETDAEEIVEPPPEGEPEGEDMTDAGEGSPERVVWSSDRKSSYQTTYMLMDLDAVQASHNLDGTENPNYAAELQPRETRGGTVSLQQIAGYAKDLRTEFLLDHYSTLSDGAPILSANFPMQVISGNGRTMAMKQAMRDHPDQWQKYQDALREKIGQYGITEAELDAMTNPVLVQVIQDGVDEVAIADDANQGSGMSRGSSEQATRDAKYLTDDVMALWTGESLEDAINHPNNKEFRTALFKNIPNKEQGGFLANEDADADDKDFISLEGIRRIRAMMLRYVFSGDYGVKLSRTLIESRFDSMKNVNNMLNIAIPSLAKSESYIRGGLRPERYSIGEELARAIGVMEQMQANGETMVDMLAQNRLFDPKTTLDDLSIPAIQMLWIMDNKSNAYAQMAAVFERYSEMVIESNPEQITFTDEITKADFFKREIFNILWENPPEELEVAGKSLPEIRVLVESYTDDLMTQIEFKAQKRDVTEPEGETDGQDADTKRADAATEETGEETETGTEGAGETEDAGEQEGMGEGDEQGDVSEGIEDEEGLEPPPLPQPPTFPQNPTLELVDYAPRLGEEPPTRTYVFGDNREIEVKVQRTGEGDVITFSLPGWHSQTIINPNKAPFTDKWARKSVQEVLEGTEIQKANWTPYPEDPRLNGGVPDQTPEEKARIAKMPVIKEAPAFEDRHFKSKRGIAFSMPGLNPAMRIKATRTELHGTYWVYIDSTNLLKEYSVNEYYGVNPLDAVQRALADVFDDAVWDGLNEKVEPDTDQLDKKGVVGNYPAPLPAKIKLVEKRGRYVVEDDAGNVYTDYAVEVDYDPFGLGEERADITISFPNHPDLEAITEIGEGVDAKSAALNAIAKLRQFDFDKGGIGAAVEPTTPDTSDTETSENLLETLPPPTIMKLGATVELDTARMEKEDYAKSGKTKIYKVRGNEASIYVTQLGDKSDPVWNVEVRYPRYNAVQYTSYNATPLGAVNDAIKNLNETDIQWKPMYKSGIFAQLDAVQNAINRAQFATTPAIERRIRGLFVNLRSGINVDLRGYKITSLKEVALLGQIFRHPSMEAHRVFYLNDEFEIVGHETTSIGVPGQTTNQPHRRIQYNMKRFGASHFVEMHNHPGGQADFSDPDKKIAGNTARTFERAYLGQIVVDSGEYAESIPYQDKNGIWTVRNRNRIQLSEAELGWNPGEDVPDIGAVMSARESVIRPDDPLYQYDISTPEGQLAEKAREIGETRRWFDSEGQGKEVREKVRDFGRYLKTEKNWTTVFFTNYSSEVVSVMEYKDLHLLDATQLWTFLSTEARKHGGMYVSAYVGEGDWYKNKGEVMASVWGEVMDAGADESIERQAFGLEHVYFAGLRADASVPKFRQGSQMLALHELGSTKFPEGTVREGLLDPEYDFDTGLSEDTPERQRFIAAIFNAVESGTLLSPVRLYEDTYDREVPVEKIHLIDSFVQMTINQYMLEMDMNPQVDSPVAAQDLYKESKDLEAKNVIVERLPEVLRQSAMTVARLANITDTDNVLTIGDNNGTLATFAKLSGAARVETTTEDAFAQRLLSGMLPIDQVHDIQPENLAREWRGIRPSVILLHANLNADNLIDEALKVLAPGGRIVFTTNDWGVVTSDKFFNLATQKYTFNRVMSQVGGIYTAYGVFDKKKGRSLSKAELQQQSLNAAEGVEGLITAVEEIRSGRPPMAKKDIGVEFPGVSASEQTFGQPISNPRLPKGFTRTGEPVSVPPDDYGLAGQGTPPADTENVSDTRTDTGILESPRDRQGATAQTDINVGSPTAPATADVGQNRPELGGRSEGGVAQGEDVHPEMGQQRGDQALSIQGGPVSESAGDIEAGTDEGIDRMVGAGVSPAVRGITTPPITEDIESESGIPMHIVHTDPPPQPPPDNTPISVSQRVKRWIASKKETRRSGAGYYAASARSGKRSLEMLGDTGTDVAMSMMRIRNFGDRLTGRALSQVLDKHAPAWQDYIRTYAKQQKLPIGEAVANLNQILARHQEGRSKTAVPKIVDDIVQDVRNFFEQNIANPMLNENKKILGQGLIFDLPEDLVDDGVLENEYRQELEADPPDFERFLRVSGMQKSTKGVVQGFVQENSTGNMYAVFVKSDTYFNPESKETEIADTTYTMESPAGQEVEGDYLMLHGSHENYTLIALRDPQKGEWEGDRDVAKHLWDTELSQTQRPDVLADYFAQNGITLPEGVRFKYSKIANIEQWSVRKDNRELFVIRRLIPVKEGKNAVEVHPAYQAFKNRLLVYKSGAVRNPIFIFRGRTAHKVWEPIENYYPHIIDWNDMSADPNDGERYQRFLKFAKEMSDIDANNMDENMARQFLTQQIMEAKTRKYGHLEQDRQYLYPGYNRNYFQVWEQYIARASHRLQTIYEFGQANDKLEAKLNEFVSAQNIGDTLTGAETAVLKIRNIAGYNDFLPDKHAPQIPFRDEQGNAIEISPKQDYMVGMSPADWQALEEAGYLEALDNGNYLPTQTGIAMLENPAFLHGAIAEGARKMSIAADIVKNQLGWKQEDIFDESLNAGLRQVRTWVAATFLPFAWASNIAQPASTMLVTNPRAALKAYWQFIRDPKNRAYAKEVGAMVIDIMHDYSGGGTLGDRVLRQQLGALPHYQFGETTPASYSPRRKHHQDLGIKTRSWTPFFDVERFNRLHGALAGRAVALTEIKKMLRNPKQAKASRETLTSIPHSYDLEAKLDAALRIPNLTIDDVDAMEGMLEEEVREQMPHLYPLYDFVAEYSKVVADWTQHRVEPIDRGRLWTQNPVFLMMQQFQSFTNGQTKFAKDAIMREWRIAHAFLQERSPAEALKNPKVAKAIGSLWFLPKFLLAGGLYGIPAAILGRLVRFKSPDDETIEMMTWFYKAGMLTVIGEYMMQLNRWNRGAEEAILGPALGTAADVAGDISQRKPLRTASRLLRVPPTGPVGPSVKQIIDMVEGEPRPQGTRGRGSRGSGRSRNTRSR